MKTNLSNGRREPIRIRRQNGSQFPARGGLFYTIVVTVIAALILVIGARAIGSLRGTGTGDVLTVPRDYPTIQAAVDAAKAGDLIHVQAGVYRENVRLDKPVTLIAESFDEVNPVNNSTVIDGGGGTYTIIIPPGLTQMPAIRGFVIQNSDDAIQASSGFLAEFNYFHSANNLVSYQKGSGGFNRNNVYFSALDNAIRLDNLDSPLVIENNRILYSGNAGIEVSLQPESAPSAAVEIDIWNNMILGNGEDGIQIIDHPGVPYDTNRRFVIAGNLIANNRRAGLGLMPLANTVEDYSGADLAEAVRVYNNTFYGNDYGISGGDNLVAFNNIITNSTARGAWRVDSAPNTNVPVAFGYSPGNNSVVAYTLFHQNAIDSAESSVGAGVLFGVDPLFEAEPNPGPDGTWQTVDDDFSGLVLRSDSPAIDRGVTQFQANNGELIPPVPITGFTGAAPDLGWREFGASIFPNPTTTSESTLTPLPTATIETASPGPTLTPAQGTPAPISETPTPVSVTATSNAETMTAIASQIPSTTPTAQLAILSIDPVSAQADATVTMTILGSGFQVGALVTFEGGQGIPQEILAVQVVDSATIVVTMTARNDTTSMQVWDVRVTNPDATTFLLEKVFTVIPLP